jgi:glycosyltransferase involved in cell wall biosynthesis
MKERILYIIDNLEFGGGERVFLQLIKGLCAKYDVSVIAHPGGLFFQELEKVEVKIYPIDMIGRFCLKRLVEIRKIINEEIVDIVHSQGARSDFTARLVSFSGKRPKIISTVAMPVLGFDVSVFKKMTYYCADWITSPLVDRYLVVSKILKNHLTIHYPISPSRIEVIYNGIEVDQYRSDEALKCAWRNKNGFQKNDMLIVAIGRLVWQKGFEYLIECVSEIARTYPDVKILIVGDGPLRQRLEALSKELGVRDNVIFAGFRSDIKEILSAIDILVIPSILEGFPMITLEAMAMAKPIIATNIDGITEQIADGVNGILVPPKDPSALAKAVMQVLNDKELARTMGLVAREKVEQEFSVEKMVSETEKVYLSLLRVG